MKLGFLKKIQSKKFAISFGVLALIVGEILRNLYYHFILPFDVEAAFIIVIPYLLFAIITAFLKQSIFKAWFNFSAVAVPLYAALFLFLTHDSGGGWSSVGAGYGGMVFLALVGLYIFVSLAIIIVQAVRTQRFK